MKKPLVLFICLLSLFISSYAQNTLTPVSVTDNIPNKKLRIDPNYAFGGKASQVFDTIVYTPLETRKDVVVGYTHNLQVSDHYFIFFDQDLRGIYVFDKNGKYISTIKKLPLDNWKQQEDGYMLFDFYLDKTSERIFVIYNDKSKENIKWLAVFSPDGALIKNIKLPSLLKDMSIRFLQINNDATRSTIMSHYNDPIEKPDSILNKYHFYKIENFDSIQNKSLTIAANDPFTQAEPWMRNYAPNKMNGGNIIWTRNFDYTTIHSDSLGHLEKFQFLLPLSWSIDSSFYRDTNILKSYDKSFAYFNSKNQVVSFITNIVMTTNNWLVFQLQNRMYPTPIMLYNLQTQKLLDLNKISSDSLSYQLPLKGWSIDCIEGNALYNIIPAFQMFSMKDSREDAPWNVNPVLKEYFQKQNRKSNPVIVELKLKSKL